MTSSAFTHRLDLSVYNNPITNDGGPQPLGGNWYLANHNRALALYLPIDETHPSKRRTLAEIEAAKLSSILSLLSPTKITVAMPCMFERLYDSDLGVAKGELENPSVVILLHAEDVALLSKSVPRTETPVHVLVTKTS